MENLSNIIDDIDLNIVRHERVFGGDINKAFCLFTKTDKYFLKINDADEFPAMFEKEARGLHQLHHNSSLIIPKVIKYGVTDRQQYLVLGWLEKGPLQKSTWENFGTDLARMHKNSQPYFGFNEDNYIGSLPQVNKQHKDWSSFYSECRVMPLIKILVDKGDISDKDVDAANLFCKKLDHLFPIEEPSLLHGDLWGGNFLITTSGKAAVYDPAVYYGHREMDIGMSKLFGGFDQHFYEAYNDHYPLGKGWESRLPLTQLYPLLVHAVLFGDHYISSVTNIIRQFS